MYIVRYIHVHPHPHINKHAQSLRHAERVERDLHIWEERWGAGVEYHFQEIQ